MKRIFARRHLALPLAMLMASGLAGCGVFGGKDKPETPTIGNRIPVLSRIESGAKVDPALAQVAVVLPTERVNEDWAQAGGTAAKASGHLALSPTPSKVWSASIAGASDKRRLAAAPVVGNGRLYAIDTSAAVHAFDAQTGSKIWTKQLEIPGKLKASAFGGGVSYADGRVYATNGIGEVAALDANTGAEIWRVKPAGPLRGAPTIAFGAVYVMTQDNQIHALDASDGSPLWEESGATALAGVFGVAAPAAGQGTVVAGYSTGELVAYRYENGRTLWSDALARTSISTQVGTLTDVDADPIIDSGQVYALGQGGRMAAYELVTGQRLWELNLAGISTPAVAGEWIFTLTDDARLLAIARTSGKVRWITQLREWKDAKDRKGQIFWTGPVLAGNRLWVANSRGKLYAVSVGDGTASEYADLGSSVSLPPVIANRMLYVLNDDGKITAFR
ncbi:MAG: PQQ-binding-like beta-propeller repeat protein [Novosphingobium sp.]|nr:PQQ-binding-like beta-propeller repeat protein [Novosphingobium sp.]